MASGKAGAGDKAAVLALDADYILTSKYIEELKALVPAPQTNGFQARFTYCINGRRLRSGVYPPVTVLYRRAFAEYSQDGHTQRLKLAGSRSNAGSSHSKDTWPWKPRRSSHLIRAA